MTIRKWGLVTIVAMGATGCFLAGSNGDAAMRARAYELRTAAEGTEHPIQPPPNVSFAEGQAALDVGAKDWAASQTPPYAIMRNYMVGRDWDMERSPSGRILDREAETVSYYRGGPNDYCFRNRGYVKQDEQGGRWGRGHVQWEAVRFRVNCQQVESLPGSAP